MSAKSEALRKMWLAYNVLCELGPSEPEINDAMLDLVAQNMHIPMSGSALAAFSIHVNFMLYCHKHGVVLPPSPELFQEWYKK